jgi:hypothetical protein
MDVIHRMFRKAGDPIKLINANPTIKVLLTTLSHHLSPTPSPSQPPLSLLSYCLLLIATSSFPKSSSTHVTDNLKQCVDLRHGSTYSSEQRGENGVVIRGSTEARSRAV